MTPFHGTPIGGSRQDVARFLVGRHALVATITDDVTNAHPERHALRRIKHMASQHLDAALVEVEALLSLKAELRDLVKELKP